MRGLITLVFILFAPAAWAQCSFSNPNACGSPGMKNVAIGGTMTVGGAATFSSSITSSGATLNGSFGGSPTFSAGATVSGGAFTSGVASSSGQALFFGPLAGTNGALKVSQTLILSGSTAPQIFRTETSMSGTTSGNPAINIFSLTDNLAAAAGVNESMVSVTYGGSGFTGGRNGQWVNVTSNADSPSGSNSFLVASAPWWRASHWLGGFPGHERAAVFGINPLGWLGTSGSIGARGIRGVQGAEIDAGAVPNILYRDIVRLVEWGSGGSNPGKGLWSDAALSIGQITSQGMPGLDTFFALRDSIGDWALSSTGAIMEVGPTQIGSPKSVVGGKGIDLTGITFTAAQLKGTGFNLDASGNFGGQTVAGITLETRNQVQAKTNTLSAVTVVRGGRFDGKPTLTVDAPPGSGSTATVTVNAMGIDAPFDMTSGQGSGYVVNDVLTLSGGTCSVAPQYTVTAVSSGAIVDMSPTQAGSCTVLPADPVTLTGGTGTGATVSPYWTILSITVGGAGTNYGSQTLPNITPSGVGIYQNPILLPVMAASNANLLLGTGSALATNASVGFIQVPTMAGSPSGTVGAAGQAAMVIDTTNKKLCYSTGGGTWECSAAFLP